jgi:MFS family permease
MLLGFLFGYDSGIITSTIALDSFKVYFDNLNDTISGGIVSAFQGGAIAGTILNMIGADWAGRRNTIFAGSVISCIGSALQAGAVNLPMLIVGRFIAGASVGILTSTIPIYASELAESKHRGLLSGLLQWMLSWGFLVAQWLGYGSSFAASDFSCVDPLILLFADFQSTNPRLGRFPLAFQLVPGLILLFGVYFLNESPRWLIQKDRMDDARQVLGRLRSGQHPNEIQLEFQDIHDTIIADREIAQVSWKSIISKPSWRLRLLLGCGVQAFGPLSGINVIN